MSTMSCSSRMVSPSGATMRDPLAHLVEVASALARLPQHAPSSLRTLSTESRQSTPATAHHLEDVSVVSNDEDEGQKLPASSSPSQLSIQGYSKREVFPQRLLAILSDESLTNVVSWLPHGRSFVIIRPDVFTDQVLPKYLPAADARSSTKYASFTRKLNRWGFRQATRGADTGAFSHPLFQRDQPELCHGMVCQRSRNDLSSPEKSPSPQKPPRKMVGQASPGKRNKMSDAPVVTTASAAPDVDAQTHDTVMQDAPIAMEPAHSQAFSFKVPVGITSDQILVQSVLKQRDELERLRAAKVMLYESFMKVLQAEDPEATSASS